MNFSNPKHRRRFFFIIFIVLFIASGVGLILYTLNEHIVFYHTPSEIKKKYGIDYKDLKFNEKIYKVGGLIKQGSVYYNDNNHLNFVLYDSGGAEFKVTYYGIPPGLFREGSGAIVDGYFFLDTNGELALRAVNILSQHDENYIPQYKYQE